MIDNNIVINGFSSCACKSGLKNNDYDLAIIKSSPPSIVSAMYTTNKFQAAPVKFSKKNDNNKIELLIVNSQIANALTGKDGDKDTLDITKKASEVFKCKKNNILMASTGIIGKRIDKEKVKTALESATLNNDFKNIIKAIKMRDRFDKTYHTKLKVENKIAKFYAIAKGTSTVHPNMATVLLFIFTDLNVDKKALDKAFKESIQKTLNRISIDAETSTNDTAIIMANATCGNTIITENNKTLFTQLKNKLDEICTTLAKMIVLDGEGKNKTIIVSVKKSKTKQDAFDIAKRFATSSLVKILFASENIRYKKLLVVIGNSNININNFALSINNVNIFSNGELNTNENELSKIKSVLNNKKEYFINIDCGYNTKYEDYYCFTEMSQEYIEVVSSYDV